MAAKVLVLLLLLSFVACMPEAKSKHAQDSAEQTKGQVAISEQRAISIAQQDAPSAQLSTDSYNIFVINEKELWHVIFEPKDRQKDDVEPVYLIFKEGGKIFERGNRHLPHGPRGRGEIESDKAMAIAKADAIKHVRIEGYAISAYDEREFWHVVFSLSDTNKVLAGGGPDYLIDKVTGKIAERKFYQ